MEEDKWKIIDTHLNAMMDFTSGMSTGATNNHTAGNQRPGHIHRKSEPDVVMIRKAQQSRIIASQSSVPQSAPVQPGTFALDWNSMTKRKVPSCDDDVVTEDVDVITESVNVSQFPELEAFGTNATLPVNVSTAGSNSFVESSGANLNNIPETDHSRFMAFETPPRPPPYTRLSGNGHVRTPRPSMPTVLSEIPFNGNSVFTSTNNATTKNSLGYQSPRINRRSSMPGNQLDPRAHSASPNITRRSTSIQPLALRRKTQDSFMFVPTMIPNSEVNPVPTHPTLGTGPMIHTQMFTSKPPADTVMTSSASSIGKADDQEYTKALLQHQRDRMERLQRELETKKELLASLHATVGAKEKEVFEKQNEKLSTSMPKLDDVTALRDLNRKMEIECNCMIKEVDMVSKSGNSVNENFHEYIIRKNPSGEFMNQHRVKQRSSRKNSVTSIASMKRKPPHNDSDAQGLPSPPLPPPPPPPEEWSCKWCTYLNHPALNKCEMCEYRRDRLPAAS